jgi:hypothetical protein
MTTQKARHNSMSHKLAHNIIIAKEYVFANAYKLEQRRSTCSNSTYQFKLIFYDVGGL